MKESDDNSSGNSMSEADRSIDKGDEKLFDVMNDEYKNIVNQFALAVFGIGALFFAAGQVETQRLKQLIDLIGFGAAVTMWIHAHGAHQHIDAIKRPFGPLGQLS
jgi:hypothetical protein